MKTISKRIWWKCSDCDCAWYSDGESYKYCPECGCAIYEEIDEEEVEEFVDIDNIPRGTCPRCGNIFDDADFDFQICHKCGWDKEDHLINSE